MTFMPEWLSIAAQKGQVASAQRSVPWWEVGLRIEAKDATVMPGDWVLRMPDGDLTPLDHETFTATYEEIADG